MKKLIMVLMIAGVSFGAASAFAGGSNSSPFLGGGACPHGCFQYCC
jgi:hypothetical protein